MAGLPLFQLPPALLERLFAKFEWKSYFRMQRTCRNIEEFVRTNRNAKVSMGCHLTIDWKSNPDGSQEHVLDICGSVNYKNVTGLYGVRLNGLAFLRDKFEECLNVLKKYRFTVKSLLIPPCNVTKEQWLTLLNLLKPIEVTLNSQGSNKFEVLLEYKKLRRVDLCIDLNPRLDKALYLIKAYLPTLDELHFRGLETNSNSLDGPYLDFFKSVLQFLHSEPLPKLRILQIDVLARAQQKPLPPVGQILQAFTELNPTLAEQQKDESYTLTFAFGRMCQFRITKCYESPFHMAGLPLGQLPPALLERIVTKLAWRSYIRMQRTCRYMEELVRSSQHVKASTDWGVYIKFTSDEEPDGWKYIMDVWIPGRDAPTADVSGLYGIRLDAYTVSIDILEDTLYILEKHRFTCEYLFIPPSDLTKDECSWIFDVLKPTKVKMHSEGSDRYEALLEYNQLKQVELWINLNSEIELDLPLIKTYLNRFEDVRFCGMESKRNSLKESYLGFFRSLLEFLYSESLPNLRNVEITVMPMETINPLPEADEIREIFAKFNPTELVDQNYGYHSRCTPIFTFGYSDQFRFEWKSYFRMQRACRGMEEFVRASRNMTVSVDWKLSIDWKETTDGSYRLTVSILGRNVPIDITDLCGVRLKMCVFPVDKLEDTLNVFKKYRITCSFLHISSSDFTKEQCLALFTLLKPTNVSLHSEGSNSFEALLQCKQLKEVALWTHLDAAFERDLSLIKTYLSRCRNVRFHVIETEANTPNGLYFDSFKRILEFIHTVSLPNLLNFWICIMRKRPTRPFPPLDEMVEAFRPFHPTVVEQHQEYYTLKCALGQLCQVNITPLKWILTIFPSSFLIESLALSAERSFAPNSAPCGRNALTHLSFFQMAAFRFSQLPSTLLERIVTKLEWRSYFRLQLTCHEMEEFVRTNRNVKICLNKNSAVYLKQQEDEEDPPKEPLELITYFTVLPREEYDASCLYGVRFKEYYLPTDILQHPVSKNIYFEEYRDFLKKHRFTCEELFLDQGGDITKEQCLTLLKLLKPQKICLVSEGSSWFEALLEAKELEEIRIMADFDDFLGIPFTTVKKLLSRFRDVHFRAARKITNTTSHFFNFAERILQFLRSELLLNLRKFVLHGYICEGPHILPPLEELLNLFGDFSPTVLRQEIWQSSSVVISYRFQSVIQLRAVPPDGRLQLLLLTSTNLSRNMGNRLGAPSRRREKPEHAALKIAMRSKQRGVESNKLPPIAPKKQCLLRLLKQNRIHDYLLLEREFILRQNVHRPLEVQRRQERKLIHKLRGSPTCLARVHELFQDEQHAVVVIEGYKREWYVPILSIVDKDLLRLNALVMVKASGMYKTTPTAVVGVLDDSVDSNASGYKVEKAPKETFDDIGGCESQIQELKESVELPLTHPEYYQDMGITAPKGVILYGEPGTGKTLLAKAVANSTAATFIRATGSDLVRKNSGDGAKLVRELFKLAKENAPSIVFLDEIDAVGTKRFDSTSRGEQEVQRTLLELLNQLDGFESRGDVKIIMATNRIDSLDPALIRPGRIDRKIEFPKPDEKTKQKIFAIHTSAMNIASNVTFEEILSKEKSISGAEIKAICSEAGMLALRGQRKMVCRDDFEKAIKTVLLKQKGGAPEEFYL